MKKAVGGVFVPADAGEAEKAEKLPIGDVVYAEHRNQIMLNRHRKLFKLFVLGFERWEPEAGDGFEGVAIAKSLDRYRKELTIMAGFYVPTFGLAGGVKLDAESLAFNNTEMTQARRDELYSRVFDLTLERVLRNYTRDDLDRVVDELMELSE